MNGLGYDPWAGQLVAADGDHPKVVDVGGVLHLRDGDNPHRWYEPADVRRIVGALASDYASLDPADASYFRQRAASFERVVLAPYHRAIASIRQRFAGTPVGASESIFALLAPSLGLRILTPPSFLRATSEGNDVSAGDVETVDRQITHHRISVYVYNSQNVTPEVQKQLSMARTAHIPVATITETLAPAGATYQAWQTRQLRGIAAALTAARRSAQ
jgi:zinc/manganese transport system substrate-binding protein